jgi:hypothetical protein
VGGIDTSSTALRAANAFARTAALVPEAVTPVRPTDVTKPRFEIGERGASADAQAARTAFPNPANDDASSTSAVTDQTAGRSRNGLIGALTAFVAKILGQAGEADGAAPSSFLSGIRAYASAAARSQAPQAAAAEVLPPSLPVLASGRVLDLSV